ncbi:MAG: hypothetical protein AB7E60_14150 [Sphingobium sp.]
MANTPLRAESARCNIVPIRPGLPIPTESRLDDRKTGVVRRMMLAFSKQEDELEPGSAGHRLAIRMRDLADELPCNNLEVIRNPSTATVDWFWQAYREAELAIRKKEWVEAQWSLARFHDERAGTSDSGKLGAARRDAGKEETDAIAKLIHTPVLKMEHLKHKQRMLGNREWASKYRPELQSVLDEELERLTAEKDARRAAREARKAKRGAV